MKDKRIIFTISNQGDRTKLITAEESYYWRRQERDLAECGFWVQGKDHGIELMGFFIPREFTELFSSPQHWTGKKIKLRDELKDYNYVDALDCSPYITRWPLASYTRRPPFIQDLVAMYKPTVTEIEKHQKTILHGWAKLVCVWLNESIPDIVYQLPWWETYLQEEMKDFRCMYQHIQQSGVKSAIENPRDYRTFLPWLKIASSTIELLSEVCPAILAVLKLDNRQSYPCLYVGYQWMKHHHLGSWEKVKNLSA